ncbi:unnamed protein product [Pleuronectes platessa]|uniref:Uncharacterized protein n=1 Tax=Pleuronectes platessa TaxID=8262 RepID=A0A9N7TZG4_PLEPL|nr:unnamed protein product [Pleuronectes platessa]
MPTAACVERGGMTERRHKHLRPAPKSSFGITEVVAKTSSCPRLSATELHGDSCLNRAVAAMPSTQRSYSEEGLDVKCDFTPRPQTHIVHTATNRRRAMKERSILGQLFVLMPPGDAGGEERLCFDAVAWQERVLLLTSANGPVFGAGLSHSQTGTIWLNCVGDSLLNVTLHATRSGSGWVQSRPRRGDEQGRISKIYICNPSVDEGRRGRQRRKRRLRSMRDSVESESVFDEGDRDCKETDSG